MVPDLVGADFATVVLDDTSLATTCLNPVELMTGGVTLRLDAKTPVHRIVKLVLALKTEP